MMTMVIAAPHSGSGKTTVTLGIMAALTRRGLKVAPFKVGPDFIDPGYHGMVTGAASTNLDGWMCPPGFVRATFEAHAAGADIAVVEGVMGLFDGIDGVTDAGSTAEVAKLLDSPVVLVVDARSQARSAAALIHGFASFDPAISIAAVVFNNVGSANHERLLREAMSASLPGIAVLGCLPKDPAVAIPSRHLGLMTAEENPLSEEFLAHLVEVIEERLDFDLLLSLQPDLPAGQRPISGRDSSFTRPLPSGSGSSLSRPLPFKVRDRVGMGPVRIAVARDAAFCFAYEDNLRLLGEQGAELCFFSPLADAAIPENISGIYLPGGYPELFAETLSGNEAMKSSIHTAVESGMPVYAECGGFIYLTRGVEVNGVIHPFAGIFPVTTRMLPRRKALGYRQVDLLEDSVIGKKGAIARGHEFHYSEMEEMPPSVERLYTVSRKDTVLGREGFRYRNCLGSYIHLHFGSSPGIAETFVGHCRTYMKRSVA